MKKLWYQAPADAFESALPIGNGRLGGMVYGDPVRDRLSLNEDTLWSGYPRDKAPKDAWSGIAEAKELVKAGKIGEAERVIWQKSLGSRVEWYQPAGSLWVECLNSGAVTDYRRELDLETAVAGVQFLREGFRETREVFCTHADGVLIYRVRSDAREPHYRVRLETPHPGAVIPQAGVLMWQGNLPVSVERPQNGEQEHTVTYDPLDHNRALTYAVGIRPILLSGEYRIVENTLEINSGDFFLAVDAQSNFEGFDRQPRDSEINPAEQCAEKLAAIEENYVNLLTRHQRDYRSLFDRVRFELNGTHRDDLPTDQRLMRYAEDSSDVGLPELLFDYSRYLTIASSRPGTQPTNLQGIWNESVTPPWNSDYTLNINTEMNYWLTEAANLSECHEPLLGMIAQLQKNGEITAKRNYHCGGWCCHHNTDLWRYTEPVGDENNPGCVVYGFWNMSGAWLATHIWHYYRYTGDKAFLEEYWPVMKGAAQFLLDWLEPDEEGFLTTPLATSPENHYLLSDGRHSLSWGSAMDLGIIRDLFGACIQATGSLQADGEFAEELTNALQNLRPYCIGADGGILEWNKEVPEEDPNHRHISLLYGLYPGNSMNENTPELCEAARVILNRRGYEATGWALGWRICAWARLKNGEEAKKFVDNMLRLCRERGTNYSAGGGVYENLLVAHPPFQIDGNFAFGAGIIEMLVQTHNGSVELLPALPEAWAKGGTLRGIRLPGKREMDLVWKDGHIVEQKIKP